ncbi:MAG: hypothetical protein ABSH28_01775 [Acidobacteriota bacterium]|jgi:hypothetical protein
MEYQVYFARVGEPERGHYFPCTKNGKVRRSDLAENEVAQFRRCLEDRASYKPGRILRVSVCEVGVASKAVKLLREAVSRLECNR